MERKAGGHHLHSRSTPRPLRPFRDCRRAHAQGAVKIGELSNHKIAPANLDYYKRGWQMAIGEINSAGGINSQKVVVASSPNRVMLDKPSEGVAPVIVEQWANMVLELKKAGLSVLLSEQIIHFAEIVSNRAYVLVHEQMRFAGPMRDVTSNRELRSTYLSI